MIAMPGQPGQQFVPFNATSMQALYAQQLQAAMQAQQAAQQQHAQQAARPAQAPAQPSASAAPTAALSRAPSPVPQQAQQQPAAQQAQQRPADAQSQPAAPLTPPSNFTITIKMTTGEVRPFCIPQDFLKAHPQEWPNWVANPALQMDMWQKFHVWHSKQHALGLGRPPSAPPPAKRVKQEPTRGVLQTRPVGKHIKKLLVRVEGVLINIDKY